MGKSDCCTATPIVSPSRTGIARIRAVPSSAGISLSSIYICNTEDNELASARNSCMIQYREHVSYATDHHTITHRQPLVPARPGKIFDPSSLRHQTSAHSPPHLHRPHRVPITSRRRHQSSQFAIPSTPHPAQCCTPPVLDRYPILAIFIVGMNNMSN